MNVQRTENREPRTPTKSAPLPPRFSVLSSRFSVLGSQFSVLGSRLSVLSSRFSVLGSRLSVLSSRLSPLALIFAFWPLTALVLFCDSAAVRASGFPGQLVSNLLAPLFLLVLLPHLSRQQRRNTLLFVPFSALGEGLFSLVFGLYTYADGGVPFYVPFGHAILFAVGLLISDRPAVAAREGLVRWALIAFHASLIAGAWLALGDSLSALFGLLFVLIMLRKRGRVFYLVMGVLVLYIELLGTLWGCWYWWPEPWGVLHTLNPPVGAFACYVAADVIVMRLGRLLWRDQV